jgi:tetraacyldisaccharide 4'-kinase
MIAKDEKLKRVALWLPAKLYELGVRLRVAAYETEYFRQKQLDSTVISVGNITLGGSGKTPMVEYIARYLKGEDYRVAVLTRGYGRTSSGPRVLNARAEAPPSAGSYHEFGDEPLMLARQLPDVPIVINADRYEGGRLAQRESGAEVLVLDDGYQHLALARDLNILLVDATDAFGGFEMPPFGRLREPLYGLRRANVVIVTRADKPFDQAQTGAIIRRLCGEKTPVMYFYCAITSLRHLQTGVDYETKQLAGWNSSIVCGIGNPRAFADDVLNLGINIVEESFFSDHRAFTQEDLMRVVQRSRDAGADAIVTTEKDAVRLEGLELGDFPIYVARSQMRSEDEVRLKSLLLRTIQERK